jgi:hypothetical protein
MIWKVYMLRNNNEAVVLIHKENMEIFLMFILSKNIQYLVQSDRVLSLECFPVT